MNTEEVAKKVVEVVRKQAWYDALDLYDDNIVSVEAYSAGGGSPETRGKEGRQLSEVGVYTVKDGKIVREEFLPRV